MHIHWFPGHMTKALRMMEKESAAIDAIIYLLDCRAPLSCINPAFDSIIGSKPVVYILNKSDLVAQTDTKLWIDYFSKQGKKVLSLKSTTPRVRVELVKAIKEVCNPLIQKYLARGVRRTLRVMVIGVPNSGKSTLINSLAGQKRASTGNKPGVTRGKQWISIDPYIDVMDTPGSLFPDFSDQEKAVRLALIGSIREEVTDNIALGKEAITFLVENYFSAFSSVFPTVKEDDLPVEILEKIADSRGYLFQGAEYDLMRAARAVVADLRRLKFGKVILEKP